MKKSNLNYEITLKRNHLIEEKRSTTINDITINDFISTAFTLKEIRKASKVIFLEDNIESIFDIKVLKDRFRLKNC
jgi:propanediol dehydratase small subunit